MAPDTRSPLEYKYIVADIVQRGENIITLFVGDTLRDTLETFLNRHIAENVKCYQKTNMSRNRQIGMY